MTKTNRIALKLPKTHYHEAFCIAGGLTQDRIQTIHIKQMRRNNRSLEKFYDAKYIDARTGKKVFGQELNNGRRKRNKNTNIENLHPCRQQNVSKGRRSIRTARNFYQPNDLVKLNGKRLTVKGTHNKGNRVILKETGKSDECFILGVRFNISLPPHTAKKDD